MSAEEFRNHGKKMRLEQLLNSLMGLDEINQAGGDVAGALKEMGISSTQEIDVAKGYLARGIH